MPLTDTSVRNAKKLVKNYSLKDMDGLHLFVSSTGAKSWHFRFNWLGKPARISLGMYPEISLKDARLARDQARALLAKGADPRAARREERFTALAADENSFTAVFLAWRTFKAVTLKLGRQTSLSQIDRIFAKDVLPLLGPLPIAEISRQHLIELLRRIESRQAFTTAEKCRTWFNQLFRYAMVEKGLMTNPSADLDIVAIPKPPVTNNPYLLMEEMPPFLQKLRAYGGSTTTILGLRLLFLTGVRTGELRLAVPEQFDLVRGIWTIPAVIVKQLQVRLRKEGSKIPPYVVPLSRQAIAIVHELLKLRRPAQRYLLSHRSDLSKRISENCFRVGLTVRARAEIARGLVMEKYRNRCGQVNTIPKVRYELAHPFEPHGCIGAMRRRNMLTHQCMSKAQMQQESLCCHGLSPVGENPSRPRPKQLSSPRQGSSNSCRSGSYIRQDAWRKGAKNDPSSSR